MLKMCRMPKLALRCGDGQMRPDIQRRQPILPDVPERYGFEFSNVRADVQSKCRAHIHGTRATQMKERYMDPPQLRTIVPCIRQARDLAFGHSWEDLYDDAIQQG